MKKKLLLLIKITFMALVLAFIGRAVYQAWGNVQNAPIKIQWRWGLVAIGGFVGNMVASGLVWRALARRMGDRSPFVPIMGAYMFSQMGKYVPGKIFLVLMRIGRAGRAGMSAQVCALSTILENALYMVSGGVAGMTAIVHIAGRLDAQYRPYVWPATIAVVMGMLAVCYPPIFYALVNRLLRGMKRPEVPNEGRLKVGALALAVAGFMPCWIFGGLALWGAACAVHPLPLTECWWFAGAFALSVLFGMASFLPGGAVIREAVVAAAVMIPFSRVPELNAVKAAGIVAILLRAFQLVTELSLATIGAAITYRRGTTKDSGKAT